MWKEILHKPGELMSILKRPKWYLSDVKPLQNHPWTDREKLAVFALRDEEDLPARRVAKVFGVTKIQIYNITRLVRRSKNKECFICGNPLSVKERRKQKGRLIKSCDTCKENKKIYKQKRRKGFLKLGICPYCERRKVIKGKKGCKLCLSATHRRRYNRGLCGQCGERPITEKSDALCNLCLGVNRKRSAAQRKLKRLSKDMICKTGKSSKK